MMSCLPVCLVNCAASGRANASVPPPAGKGTIIITGRVGHAAPCAFAKGATPATPAAAAARRTSRRVKRSEFIFLSPLESGDGTRRSTVQVGDGARHRDFTLRQHGPVLVEPL